MNLEKRKYNKMPVLKNGFFDCEDEKNIILMGGDPSTPSWEDYLDKFKEEHHNKFIEMKKYIEENGMIGWTGEQFCNDNYFEFEDGMKVGFTWRAWGDFMQAIVNKNEGYMRYYM